MTVDLVLRDGRVVTTEGIIEAGIAVDNGKIVSVAKESHLPPADRTVRADGLVILPGVIDPHVHFGIYNRFSEDIPNSTSAQAVGGVTTTMHCIQDKRSWRIAVPELTKVFQRSSYVDVTFYATVMTMRHVQDIPYAVRAGVTSFKHFTNRPEYEMIGISHPDDGEMYLSFETIKRHGGVAMVHCEDYEIARKLAEPLKNSGRSDLSTWDRSRPDFVEHKKILESAFLAWVTGCPLYVVHTTVGTAKEVVDWAKARNLEMYIETCVSYLAKENTDERIGLLGKVNPPIRTRGHVEALWRGIKEGWIDCIGTDHAPLSKNRKVGKGDIWSAMLGFPGSETLLPFMISEGYNKRGIPLERIAALTSTNTARIHGIPNKGAIRVGYDADFAVVDLKRKVKLDGEVLQFTKFRDINLFEGETFTGYPVMTFVRGALVAEDLKTIGKKGYGKVIKRLPRRGPRKPTLKHLLN